MEDRNRPKTAAEIAAHTVGEARPHDGPVRLVEYDAGWPGLFLREEARIRRALGDTAARLEHVGSTSVPGLCAKPIIDMVLEVPDSSNEPVYVIPLESQGYVLRIREPDWWEHRMLEGPDTQVHLHVFTRGCPEVLRMLRFRDRLRAKPSDRMRYEKEKRELAARDWAYVQNYADAKTDVVEEILARAEAAASDESGSVG